MAVVEEGARETHLFLEISRALLKQDVFQPHIEELEKYLSDTRGSLASIFGAAASRLARICIVRINEMRINDEYATSSTTAQYDEFFEKFGRGVVYASLKERYPGLVDAVEDNIIGQMGAIKTAVSRYRHDSRASEAQPEHGGVFLKDEPLKQCRIVGDFHGKNNTSVVIETESGRHIYMKARPATQDLLYSELFEDISKRIGCSLKIPTIQVGRQPGAEYYWQENAPAGTAALNRNNTQIHNYNLGVLLTICDMTGLHDLHFENVHLNKNDVYILDVECGPRLQYTKLDGTSEGESRSALPLGDVGILPMVVGRRENGNRVRWGVMDAPATQPPLALHLPVADGTSEVRLVVEPGDEPLEGNVTPKVPLDYRSFERGVVECLRYFRSHISASWIETALSLTSDARHLVRPTQEYGDILRRASYPQVSTTREARIGHLRECLHLYNDGIPKSIVDVEVEALNAEQIPIFTTGDVTRLSGIDLTGQKKLRATALQTDTIADRSYVDYVMRVVTLQFEASYGGLGRAGAPVEAIDAHNIQTKPEKDNQESAFNREATLLASGHNPWKRDPQWPNLVEMAGNIAVTQESFSDIYGGSVGTALGELLTQPTHPTTEIVSPIVLNVYEALRRRILEARWPEGTGAYNGLAGWMYFIAAYTTKGGRHPECKEMIERCIDELESRLATSSHKKVDIISGAAGILAVLHSLKEHDLAANERLNHVASLCHDILSENAMEVNAHNKSLLVWPADDFEGLWLGGYSHGVAGIAYAASLWRQMGMGVIADRAWEAQLALFSPDNGDWEDLRPTEMKSAGLKQMQAWCHGMDGILLASAYGNGLDFEQIESPWLHAAIDLWIASDPVFSGGICHGLSSRVEVVGLLAYRGCQPDAPSWLSVRADSLENRWHELRANLTVALRDETNLGSNSNLGLLVGLAGNKLAASRSSINDYRSGSILLPRLTS